MERQQQQQPIGEQQQPRKTRPLSHAPDIKPLSTRQLPWPYLSMPASAKCQCQKVCHCQSANPMNTPFLGTALFGAGGGLLVAVLLVAVLLGGFAVLARLAGFACLGGFTRLARFTRLAGVKILFRPLFLTGRLRLGFLVTLFRTTTSARGRKWGLHAAPKIRCGTET